MKACCVVLTALLLAASAQAKLGESEEEITARWGQPANRTGPPSESYGCIYHVPGFQVIDEGHAAFFKSLDNGRVVNDLMKDIEGRAVFEDGFFHDVDRACDPGAESLCPGEKDLH